MLGQMALIQSLARGQEELRAIVNELHQDGCNRMKQIVEVGDQVIDQPPRRQEVRPFQIATTSRVQQQSRQQQQVNRRKQDTSERRFTEVNMSLAQARLTANSYLVIQRMTSKKSKYCDGSLPNWQSLSLKKKSPLSQNLQRRLKKTRASR